MNQINRRDALKSAMATVVISCIPFDIKESIPIKRINEFVVSHPGKWEVYLSLETALLGKVFKKLDDKTCEITTPLGQRFTGRMVSIKEAPVGSFLYTILLDEVKQVM